MSTTVSQQSCPIVPTPLSPDPDDATIPDTVVDGTTSYSVKRAHGRCSRFCANDEVPTTEATVATHGPLCRSQGALAAAGLVGLDGRSGGVFGALAVPYTHGVYRGMDWAETEWQGYVELSVDLPTADGGWAEGELYLTAAQARTIAAGLTYLADELERPDEPLRTERARREASTVAEVQA